MLMIVEGDSETVLINKITCGCNAVETDKSVETSCSPGQSSLKTIREESTHSKFTRHIYWECQVSVEGMEEINYTDIKKK